MVGSDDTVYGFFVLYDLYAVRAIHLSVLYHILIYMPEASTLLIVYLLVGWVLLVAAICRSGCVPSWRRF